MSYKDRIKKLSFADIVKNVDAQKSNSDLENLAHALQFVEHRRQQLNTLEEETKSTARLIEKGDVFGVDIVRGLYNKARGTVNL